MKKLFKLEDDDFNRIAEISANQQSLLQIYHGKVILATKQQRADHFWASICVKYGFDPFTVETNMPKHTARYFMAEPVEYNESTILCKLCKNYTGPDLHHGCDRHLHPNCAWNTNKTL